MLQVNTKTYFFWRLEYLQKKKGTERIPFLYVKTVARKIMIRS
jgi:hypothetical protein